MYRVGIDAGCSAVKTVVIDRDDSQVASWCSNHYGNIAAVLKKHLKYVKKRVDGDDFCFAVTGEQAKKIIALSSYFIYVLRVLCLLTTQEQT